MNVKMHISVIIPVEPCNGEVDDLDKFYRDRCVVVCVEGKNGCKVMDVGCRCGVGVIVIIILR